MVHKLTFTEKEKSRGRAVFLDRDGVVNFEPADYVKRSKEFRLNPRIIPLLWAVNHEKYNLIVVTNQRGIALNLMTHEHFEEITLRMIQELAKGKIAIDAVYYCPHNHNECNCRKPLPGMFNEAQGDFQLSLEQSAMIGNSDHDIEAARRAGIGRSFKVPTDRPEFALEFISSLQT